MWYRIGADLVVVVHFLWVVFMTLGGVATLLAVLTIWFGPNKVKIVSCRFLGWKIFRTVHLCGIVYAGILAAMGKYCPLTYLENHLRSAAGTNEYPGSFIVYYVEKIVYPHVEPMMIIVPTVLMAVLVIVAYFVYPSQRFDRDQR